MKAILEFELPVEENEFHVASRSFEYWSALYDLKQAFRTHRKHEGKPVTEEVFFEILQERGIDLDE
jgi:hypothetical protein